MSVGVVDGFETIQVENGNTKDETLPGAADQLLLEVPFKEAAVGQAGEGVMVGQVLQAFGRQVARRYVQQGDDSQGGPCSPQ